MVGSGSGRIRILNTGYPYPQVATDELLRDVLKRNPNLSYVDLSGKQAVFYIIQYLYFSKLLFWSQAL